MAHLGLQWVGGWRLSLLGSHLWVVSVVLIASELVSEWGDLTGGKVFCMVSVAWGSSSWGGRGGVESLDLPCPQGMGWM